MSPVTKTADDEDMVELDDGHVEKRVYSERKIEKQEETPREA
jgi:hypothetical protein